MPGNVFPHHPANIQLTTVASHPSSALDFLNLTLFLVSNNFLSASSAASKKAYEWIACRPNTALFDCILSLRGPTAEALTENLFRLAIDAGDVHVVKKMLKMGMDRKLLNATFGAPIPSTPLQLACDKLSLDLVRVLIEAGADVNHADFSGTESARPSPLTCLLTAVRERCWDDCYDSNDYDDELQDPNDCDDDLQDSDENEIVKTLLHAGSNVNIDKSQSPLILAVESGQLDLVNLLISAGANVGFSSLEGDDTPLVAALHRGRGASVAIVRSLLDAKADAQAIVQRDEPCTLLEVAFELGVPDTAIIRLLVDHGARITKGVIASAMQKYTFELAIYLIDSAEYGMQAECRYTAFITAIEKGEMRLIESLDTTDIVMSSASRKKELRNAMAAAARKGHTLVFQWLLGKKCRHRGAAIEGLQESLFAAIVNGHSEIQKMLLNVPGWEHFASSRSSPSLMSAAIRRKDAHLAHRLLEAGVNIEWQTDYGSLFSALPEAVKWGHQSLIRSMISSHARLNVQGDGGTALTVAIRQKDETMVSYLLDVGADVNAADGNFRRPLEVAIDGADVAMIHHLLNAGANPDERSLCAAVSGGKSFVDMILAAHKRRYGRYSQGFGCIALQEAIRSKKAEVIATLLANRTDANRILSSEYFLGSALGVAISSDDSSDLWILRMSLRGGANPNSIVRHPYTLFKRTVPALTPLLLSIEKKNLATMKALIAAGAKVNASVSAEIRRTPLQLAVEKGEMNMVETLLAHSADVNASPHANHGATALQFAAVCGYVGIACLLIQHGAEMDALPATVGGRTALEGAAEHGRIDMLGVLLNAGAQTVGSGAEQFENAKELASNNGHFAARRLLESVHDSRSLNFFAG
jgi:ankyrin repeat protein